MDYPQLNLIFGLILALTVVAGVALRVLLSKARLPVWMSILSWLTIITSIVFALYIETLFLRLMIPGFNRQIILGFLLMAAIGALITAILYKRRTIASIPSALAIAQILVSLIGIAVALGLYRSLVPISPP